MTIAQGVPFFVKLSGNPLAADGELLEAAVDG